MSGELATRMRYGAEASPFQMPTRLADGLGLESGLGATFTAPFAPSPGLRSRGIRFPRIRPQEGSQT
jgi:hypothetical protein